MLFGQTDTTPSELNRDDEPAEKHSYRMLDRQEEGKQSKTMSEMSRSVAAANCTISANAIWSLARPTFHRSFNSANVVPILVRNLLCVPHLSTIACS
jgi:hypothetical protein